MRPLCSGQVHGDEDENRYQQFSAYATTTVGGVRISADAEHLAYEAEINGATSATTGRLNLGYVASKTLELTLTGEYGQTPEYDREVSGLLAVLWRYDASTKKEGTK